MSIKDYSGRYLVRITMIDGSQFEWDMSNDKYEAFQEWFIQGLTDDKDSIKDAPASNNALLTIRMKSGNQSEYKVSMSEVTRFLNWYNDFQTNVPNTPYYCTFVAQQPAPFDDIQSSLIFDRIVAFNIDEYVQES